MLGADDPIAQAQALVTAGKAGEAVALLAARLAQARGGPLMRLTLGRAQLAAGDPVAALETLREAVSLAPGLAEAALALGEALFAQGYLPSAIAEFSRAVKLAPDSARALVALGRAWLELGEAARALELLNPLAETDADIALACEAAKAMLAMDRAPSAYVRHLFDQFSHDYDVRMMGELGYRAPAILRELCDLVGAASSPPCDIVDLGCGTGLCGARFKDVAGRLDGIDLSPRMIEVARGRGIYDTLIVGDLETALPAARDSYDLALAADTLVYLGDLRHAFAATAVCLRPCGFFLFTAEKKDGEGFELGPKRRYRHSESYLCAEGSRAGFEVMGVVECSPRDEAKQPVPGLAIALMRP